MDWIGVNEAITSLLPVLTALITAGATLIAVGLTQANANKREAARLKEERLDRRETDLRERAIRVSEVLLAQKLSLERITAESADDEFDDHYETHLYGGALQEIGHAVAMLPDAEARDQINSVLRNLPDSIEFPREFGIPIWKIVAPILFNAASQISYAYARGERPDLDKVRRYREIREASDRLEARLAEALKRAMANLQARGIQPPS